MEIATTTATAIMAIADDDETTCSHGSDTTEKPVNPILVILMAS